MQKITPFLWFDGNAEEAMNFYVSIFNNSKVVSVTRAGAAGPVISVTFQLEGQDFYALNGGPQFKFTEAISLFVSCETQAEIDTLWEKLSMGGAPGRCGWLKTSSACPGRSFRRCQASCWETKIPKKLNASWQP